MSGEVTNSLIIFLDNWLNCDMSESLYYCFYTNIHYTYEVNRGKTKELGIILPDKPILDYLTDYSFNDEVIECIKKRLIYEYEEQYKERKEKGYLDVIKQFENSQWIKFLSRIEWKFGQYDDKELQNILIEKIKNRSFFTSIDVSNNEDLIIELLESKFSANEQLTDSLAKHVTSTHVENVFLRICKDVVKKEDDPIYNIWSNLQAPTDNRGIKQKVLDVDSNYSVMRLGLKARDIAAIKEEYRKLTDKEKGSYRYRVFEACQRKLVDMIDRNQRVEIDIWLEELFEASKKHIEDKSQDYLYAIKSEDAIKGAILELIDSCFLSFDEKGFYYGNI